MANEVQQRITERDVAQGLLDAVKIMVAGMGFDVEIKLPKVAAKEAHKGTILEGYRDMGKALTALTVGYQIQPTELLSAIKQQTKPSGLVLPQ